MIHFVIPTADRSLMLQFLGDWGRELAPVCRLIEYRRLLRARRLPAGTYVFTGFDRLSPAELERAATVWRALADWNLRLLNDPLRVMERYRLLRALAEHGVNDFDVYRASEGRTPRRFPVFVREERDHVGPMSGLLPDAAALDAYLVALEAAGGTREGKLVVEYCARPGDDGLYRKYGAFNVGGRIVPNHLLFNRHWIAKGDDKVVTPATVAEELAYVADNPHERALREVFAIAGIDYGRIDYGLVDGRLQVYEINTYPQVMTMGASRQPLRQKNKQRFAKAIVAALAALDADGRGVRVTVPAAPRREEVKHAALEAGLRLLPALWQPRAFITAHRMRWALTGGGRWRRR